MNAPGEANERPIGPARLDEEARADALDVLTDLPQWRLASQRWERVEQIVGLVAEAVNTGDVDSLREAIAELELAGPVRATRIGATPLVPPPERVRDRANHLVHSLGGAPQHATVQQVDSTGGPGGGGGRKPAG